MGIVWAVIGVGVVTIALGVWLFVRARRQKGRVISIFGGVVLILAAMALLACYLPVFLLPDVAAESAVFNQPAPVDASATVFFLSPAEVNYDGPSVPTDTLIAITARTGVIRWQRTLPGTISQLVVEGDIADVATLLAPGKSGIRVAAYRGADGALLWQATVAGGAVPHAALAAAGDAVYLLTGIGQPTPQTEMTALGAADGSQLWSVEGFKDVYATDEMLIASPDVVYLAATPGLRVYRASDGKLLWSHVQLAAAPVAGDGVAYLPLSDGGFAAVRAADGAVICQAGGGFEVHSGALDGETLYLAGLILSPENPPNPTAVYAYDAATCAPRWHAAYAANDVVAGGGVAYIVSAGSGTVTALRAADGRELWHSNPVTSTLLGMGWHFSTQPALLGTTVFATSGVLSGGIQILGHDGWIHLYAFAGGSGFEYWQEPVGQRTRFSAPWAF